MKLSSTRSEKTQKGQIGVCEVCKEFFTATRTGQRYCSRDCGRAIHKTSGDRELAYKKVQQWKLLRTLSPKSSQPLEAPLRIRSTYGVMCCPANCGRRIAPTATRCLCGWKQQATV